MEIHNSFARFEQIFIILQQCLRHHEAKWAEKSKLSLLETMLLRYVVLNGPQKMKDIAEHFSIKLSTLTSLIDKTERRQILTRKNATDDRRVIMLEYTPKGKKVFLQYRHEINRVMKDLQEQLGEERFGIFCEALQQFQQGTKGTDLW